MTCSIDYTDIDPFCCAWLEELIADGEIPHGRVLERDVRDLRPDELVADQVHLFAGIGGWALALRIAEWQGPVWTVSCPCQPFSAAGRMGGMGDERHLWPAVRRLVAECRPPTIFGEQVASRLGREWLAGVRADLEALGYAVGAADLCAAGVGAPHIRQRLFWVADARTRSAGWRTGGTESRRTAARRPSGVLEGQGIDCGLAYTDSAGLSLERREEQQPELSFGNKPDGHSSRLDNTNISGLERIQSPERQERWAEAQRLDWEAAPILCADGEWRAAPVEPRLFPLADARTIRNRVATLRGAGNAIVPQLAAEFVRAAM